MCEREDVALAPGLLPRTCFNYAGVGTFENRGRSGRKCHVRYMHLHRHLAVWDSCVCVHIVSDIVERSRPR